MSRSRLQYSSVLPSWVEPPPTEPGSIDPLGYLGPSDRIAEQLLPGATVLTRRARYLSFLCWALRETDNEPSETDRWEIALSVGEHLRHGDDTECTYLGSRLLRGRALARGDRLPRRLHVQTARLQYSGLLRSCGLADDEGNVSHLGAEIADTFGRYMPRSIPKRVSGCDGLPCLSKIGDREASSLRRGFFETTDEAGRRLETFREVGTRNWRRVLQHGPAVLLRSYMGQPNPRAKSAAQLLHEAASLELESLPLTRLFLELYSNAGSLAGSVPRSGWYRVYQIRETSKEMLADVAGHLRRAAALGRAILMLSLPCLKAHVLHLHRVAKADAPWVDQDWRILRPGLKPQRLPGVHEYRLTAFASLLHDIGEI